MLNKMINIPSFDYIMKIPATSTRVSKVKEKTTEAAPLLLPASGMTRPCGATWAKFGPLRASETGVPSETACSLSSSSSRSMTGLSTAGGYQTLTLVVVIIANSILVN